MGHGEGSGLVAMGSECGPSGGGTWIIGSAPRCATGPEAALSGPPGGFGPKRRTMADPGGHRGRIGAVSGEARDDSLAGTRPTHPARVVVGKMAFDVVDQAGAERVILDGVRSGRGGMVVTANLDHLRRYGRDPGYASIADGAELVVADGMPIIWASRLQGTPLPERVAGSSMVVPLSRAAGRAGLSVYLLGGSPGVAERAAGVLERDCPGLRIAGWACPAMGFEDDPEQMQTLGADLVQSGADLVFVALGSPKQERVIAAFRERGVLANAWWLGVGISLSFLTGDVRRAPAWMQRAGLEWLHRMSQEPGRLARRYLVDGLPFAARLWMGAAIRRARA